MIKTRRWKRRFAAAAASIAILAVLWLVMPLWMSVVLRPALAKYGAHYEAYHAVGLTRFLVTGFGFTNASVQVQAQRVIVLAPNAWLWRLSKKNFQTGNPFVQVDRWKVRLLASTNGVHGTTSAYTNSLQVTSVFRQLRRWLPLAVLSKGSVSAPDFSVTTGNTLWSNGVLQTSARLEPMTNWVMLVGDFTALPRITWQGEIPSLSTTFNGLLFTNQTGLALSASGDWLSNRFELTAQFEKESVLPRNATFAFKNFELPAAALHLQPYEQVSGSVELQWQEPRFELQARAKASPPPRQSSVPPTELTLQAHGDTNSAIVDSALLTSPWLTAQLSSNLTVHFKGELLPQPAFLHVKAALTNQPWLPLEGVLNGDAELTPGSGFYPHVAFRLVGSEVGVPKVRTQSLALNGWFEWPLVHLDECSAKLENGAVLTANAEVDAANQEARAGRLSFNGEPLAGWLPPGWSVGRISAAADIAGPLKNPSHRGVLDAADLTPPECQAMQVHAQWSATALQSGTLEARLRAGQSELRASGAVQQTNHALHAVLDNLSLKTGTHADFELSQPFTLAVDDQGSNRVIALGPVDWVGPGSRLALQASLSWPQQGNVRLSVSNFDSAVLSAFIRTPLEGLAVHELEGSAVWTNSIVLGHLGGSASAVFNKSESTRTNSPALPVSVSFELFATERGLWISNFVAAVQNSTAVDAHGNLPILIRPTAPTALLLLKGAPLQVSATARPEALFWNQFARLTGLEVVDPRLRFEFSGTWTEPLGSLHFTAAQLQPTATGARLPSLNGLLFDLKVDREQVVVTNLQVLVQGIPVSLTGQLPLGEQFWEAIRNKEKPPLLLERASAHLQVEHGDVSLVTELLPKLLAPQGELDADLHLKPGGRLEGNFSVARLRSRPIPGLGPIRDISEQTVFQGDTATATASASIGGARVSLAGSASLAGHQWLWGEMPPLQFSLRGTNVPLSRSPNSIIRSDLDMSILKTNGTPPLISGQARLRDSYFLSDLRLLVPGNVSTPSRRPPYFSIEDPVLADWRLAARVTGSRFLRVRTPLFNGDVSASLQLHGTLKDPVATGDLRIDSGVVRFPFSSLDVQQGFVTLAPQNPFRPQLSVTAAAKQFGYDIKMEASGSADSPIVQFSSTPPLSSEQVILMVTAGQAPREQQVFSTQQRAETVGLFLGRDLLSQLGLGENTPDRLTVRSGEQISETGHPTYNIEYKLSPKWSLTGEYDRFNQYNVGVQWRVYSK